jgi:hypothetical protein
MKTFKATLLKLGIEILNSILGAKLIKKTQEPEKINNPLLPKKARCPNGNN